MNRFLPLLAITLLLGCTQKPRPNLSFYHWKQSYQPSALEEDYLDSVKCRKLYMRFFDVDFPPEKATPQPLSMLEIKTDTRGREVIPCVYITNRTFTRMGKAQVSQLARRTHTLIQGMAKRNHLEEIRQVQIDCDWSSSTRKKYFRFLEELKTHFGNQVSLSATIRLHQVKYREKTGVPPVDHGVLMLYNMGNIMDPKEANSILQLPLVKQYISPDTPDYPLQLDLALPTYTWVLVYRFQKLVRIIHPGDEEQLINSSKVESLPAHQFEVRENFYYGNTYLYRGDRLRFESISPGELRNTLDYLEEKTFLQPREIIFYHLDSINLKRYDATFYQNLCS
ncbi:MAG: hypothetical protein ACEPOZ_06495 [Marinifilaceae bacterium]